MTTMLRGETAVITGASRGIGRAIAERLAREQVEVILAARHEDDVALATQTIVAAGGKAQYVALDVADLRSIRRFTDRVRGGFDKLRILVNCAGRYSRGAWEQADVAELESLLDTNVRGVFALTQQLLPLVVRAQGDVVFINSSVVDADGRNVAHYAAAQRARDALAAALRAEINERGVRVLSVYPGRTATMMQAVVHEAEGRAYVPERLLQPQDVAEAVVACLRLPPTAEVTELRIRPRYKS